MIIMVKEYIEVRGASENNLRDLSIKLPRDKLIVIKHMFNMS